MRQLMIRFCTLMLIAFTGSVMAHPNHDHEEPLSETQVAELGDKALPAIIKSRKLNATWQKAQRQETAVRDVGGREIWVVKYQNPTEKDATQRLLYVFFDDLGNFLEANFSGKPPEG